MGVGHKSGSSQSKFYAVQSGFKRGIYYSWTDCEQQIKGFPGARYKSFLTYNEAEAFVSGQGQSTVGNSVKYYGVRVGNPPGVYTDWPTAQRATTGVKGALHKKFCSYQEALDFVQGDGAVVAGVAPETKPDIKEDLSSCGDETTERSDNATPIATPQIFKEIYTDGACRGNGHSGANAGVGVFFGPGDPNNISEPLQGKPQTNQRAELTAILRALQVVSQREHVRIISDSQYSIKCVTEWCQNWVKSGWKTQQGPVKNRDLIEAILALIELRKRNQASTEFRWEKGHATCDGNIAADLLAVAGCAYSP